MTRRPGAARSGSGSGGGSGPRGRGTGRAAERLLALAARRLPVGVARERYRREWAAELAGLRDGRRVRYALGVLVTAGALRRAVGGVEAAGAVDVAAAVVPRRTSLGCWARLHHHWVRRSTPDGERYLACARCGKVYAVGSTAAWPMTMGAPPRL